MQKVFDASTWNEKNLRKQRNLARPERMVLSYGIVKRSVDVAGAATTNNSLALPSGSWAIIDLPKFVS